MNRLIKLHKDLCRELGIHPAKVSFDDELYDYGAYLPKDQIILINRKMSRQQLETVVAHETYHHYQYIKGWLTETHWRGRHIELLIYMLEWKKRPWEIGANRYAAKQRKLKGWK